MKTVYYDTATGQVNYIYKDCDRAKVPANHTRIELADSVQISRDMKWDPQIKNFIASVNPVQPIPDKPQPTKDDYAAAITDKDKLELIAKKIGLIDL